MSVSKATSVIQLAIKYIKNDNIVLDPGIGFGKTAQHNIQLIGHLDALNECTRPIVIGLSRKRFLGFITGRDVDDRLAGSLGAMAYSLMHGAHIVRVHDVKESHDVVQVVNKLILENKK